MSGVDGCDCEETLRLIGEGKINTEPLIPHTYSLDKIEEAYYLFENKIDHVMKVAIECECLQENRMLYDVKLCCGNVKLMCWYYKGLRTIMILSK